MRRVSETDPEDVIPSAILPKFRPLPGPCARRISASLFLPLPLLLLSLTSDPSLIPGFSPRFPQQNLEDHNVRYDQGWNNQERDKNHSTQLACIYMPDTL